MHRILIAECKLEVSSFNPALSHYEDFAIARGDDLLRHHHTAPSEVAGALGVFRAQGQVEVVPTYSARALSRFHFYTFAVSVPLCFSRLPGLPRERYLERSTKTAASTRPQPAALMSERTAL